MTGESLMAETAPRSPLHRRWQLWAVLGGIGALMGLLAYGLTVDPKLVKSPLIAGPLGLCFLPAFVCLGIVPVVAGLAGDVFTSGIL